MIFDCHVHTGGKTFLTWWHNVIKTEKDFISYLKKCKIDRAVLLPGLTALAAKKYPELKKGNEEVLDMVKKYPKMFVPAMVATPDCLEESLADMEYYREAHNVCWLGEQCFYFTGYKYDSEAFRKILAKAADLDMVVQLHTDAKDVAFVPKEFPSLSLVIPHPGGSLGEINDKIRLAAKHKNVYLDLCGSGGERLGNIEEMVDKIGPNRILFGSDFTVNEPGAVISRVKNSMLKATEKKAIFSGNIIRLLKSKGAIQ